MTETDDPHRSPHPRWLLHISLQYYADGEAWWACADMFLLNRGLNVSTGDRTYARVPCHANRKGVRAMTDSISPSALKAVWSRDERGGMGGPAQASGCA